MKKTIWKYELTANESQTIEMPKGAEILTVQIQGVGPICIWALVDPEEEKEKRFFETFGTGHEIHCDMGVNRVYIGTFQLMAGSLVFHVFERL